MPATHAPRPRPHTVVKASLIAAAPATAMLLLASSAGAAPYPAKAFTISPVSAPQNCATLAPRAAFGATPCSGAPTQHFTYDAASKHLINGNGECVGAGGAYGVNLTATPCTGNNGAAPPIVVDANPAGTSANEHISYTNSAGRGKLICFTLGTRNVIGGQSCNQLPSEDFSVNPVP